MSFAASDSTYTWQGGGYWEREDDDSEKVCVCVARGGGGYSRETIGLNIYVWGGDYSRKAINGGTAIIRGNTVL